MQRQKLWWAAVILWCLGIFMATASPMATGSSTQSVVQELLNVPEPQAEAINVSLRKTGHVTAFGILAVLVWFALGQTRKAYLWAWAFATLYGGIDELHQRFVPDRGPSLIDVGIDSIGAALALAVVYGVARAKRRI